MISSNGNNNKEVAYCSLCGAMFNRTEARFKPFCSNRCQMIDLGKWLDEEYGMPFEGPSSGQPQEPRQS